ncbi:hypothetical protein fugu_002631 [Takifugu bimaculatus]|uniref:Uncharacterized protein n=1 Tax=Takifugu bimaculatus TaxID=433685 RepID=A0A4Z2BEA6_9TELE|nr:hypothetical protein fugu_002631 [Takifugu bimaculatus]
MPLCPHTIHSVYTFGHGELYRYVIVVHTYGMKMDTQGDAHMPLYQDKVINNMGQSVADGCSHHTHTHTFTHTLKTLLGEEEGYFRFFREKSLNVERSADCSRSLHLFSDPPFFLIFSPSSSKAFLSVPITHRLLSVAGRRSSAA